MSQLLSREDALQLRDALVEKIEEAGPIYWTKVLGLASDIGLRIEIEDIEELDNFIVIGCFGDSHREEVVAEFIALGPGCVVLIDKMQPGNPVSILMNADAGVDPSELVARTVRFIGTIDANCQSPDARQFWTILERRTGHPDALFGTCLEWSDGLPEDDPTHDSGSALLARRSELLAFLGKWR